MWDIIKFTIINNKRIRGEQKEKGVEKKFEEILTKQWADCMRNNLNIQETT